MGKYQRDKGIREERNLIHIFRAYNIEAQRIPLSGATDYEKGDLVIKLGNKKLRVEAKVRKNSFKSLYNFLSDADICVVRADKREALVVIPIKLFCSLHGQIEGNKEVGE